MKRLLLFILFTGIFTTGYSQEGGNIIDNSLFSCSYFGEELKGRVKDPERKDSAFAIIRSIVDVIGLKPNFQVLAANIPDAAAVVYKGTRYLLYNDRFISQVNKTSGSKWAAVTILAHEAGHHLNGHMLLNSYGRPEVELEADAFSGFILRKLGAELKDAQAAIRTSGAFEPSFTHPGRDERLNAIASGWNLADVQMEDREVPPKTDAYIEIPLALPKLPASETLGPVEKNIAFDVYFRNDPGSNYYVTTRNNLLKVEDKKLYMAGMMAQSNKKYYVGMFYDRQFNYLYITKDLYIVNGAGRLVGTMKRREFPFNIQ